MKRRLFNAGAVVSLVLSVAVVVMWVRSYWRAETLALSSASKTFAIAHTRGHVAAMWGPRWLADAVLVESEAANNRNASTLAESAPWRFRWMGFAGLLEGPPSARTYGILLPHWSLALGVSLVPGWWILSRSRRLSGVCPACGYDLRGSVSKTCPECGAEREAKA